MSTLEDMKARLAALQPPRPWYVDNEEMTVRAKYHAGEIIFDRSAEGSVWQEHDESTAKFIANAPTDIARLIAALEAVEALSYVKSLDPLIWGSDIRAIINEALEES